MSKEILHHHELRVVFEEDEDNVVYWKVEPDEVIQQVVDIETAELTERGAPLAATGIKELKELLCDRVIDLALNKADNHRWRRLFRRLEECRVADEAAPDVEPEHNSLRLLH